MSNRKNLYANMEKFRKTRNSQKRRYYRKTAKYERRTWTLEEEEAVLDKNMTDTELSKKIKRSVCATQNRRHILKRKLAM